MCSTVVVLILVRHGRTEANAAGLLLGHLDPPLDAVGRAQAELVACAIGSVHRVVTSPLRRAMETADFFEVAPEVDERWIELDYGSLDGTPVRDVTSDVWARWRQDPDFVPGGGESLAHLHDRVVDACEDVLDSAVDHDVVVVSHVSPIKAAMAWALGVGIDTSWRAHLDQASITRIGVGRRGPVLRSFNETQHLDPRGARGEG